MRAALRPLYAATAQLARLGAALAPAGGSKLARTFAARRGIRRRYARWAAAHRDPARPLLWMHAPSVGEGLQARPVLALLRARHPALQLAYTHYSPSAERFAASLDVDFRDYLPFDTTGDARAALDALAPRALVFSKLDVWPALTRAAAARGVRLGLISATLADGSSRGRGLAAMLLGDAYAALDAVGAIDAEDALRLVRLGVREQVVEVTGDTRYDQVWARAEGVDRRGGLLGPLASSRPTVVAGSTWPTDEAPLLHAYAACREHAAGLRLIIAPHEPTPEHLAPIERWAREARIPLARLGTSDAAAADIVLVDRVGVLGDLYALADVAYVGGGFHSAGLHSVLEPAAFGAPVLFGPRHAASRDAVILVAQGAGVSAPDRTALAAALRRWIDSPDRRADAGARARRVIESGLGAAERSARLVERLLER
ncbi:MAG TPA: glycosyltransferase N-terminal domain-containing protein [Gemmatimonadaceae bacterium]|nr:glycosyltransferase N-terminal domain-containing protein [Gemmatimonadaceae bacterium]